MSFRSCQNQCRLPYQQSTQEYAKKEKEKRLVSCSRFGPEGITPPALWNAGNFSEVTVFPLEVTVHMTDRFLLGGGDRTFHLGLLLSSAGKWLIKGAMAAVGLVTEFCALRNGGVRPFTLNLRWA